MKQERKSMKKGNQYGFWGNLTMVVLFMFFIAKIGQCSPIEQATHIIHGTVLPHGKCSDNSFRVRVDEVLKDIDNSLSSGSIINIHVEGCVDESGMDFIGGRINKIIVFEDGTEVILPLIKWYTEYRLFEPSEPFAISIVNSGHVYNYDPILIERPVRKGSMRDEFLGQLNRKWKQSSPLIEKQIQQSVASDVIVRQQWASKTITELNSLQNYLQLLRDKIESSDITVARNAFHAVLVSVVDKKKEEDPKVCPAQWISITLRKEKDIKGKTNRNSWKHIFPTGRDLCRDGGVPIPEVKTRGILLLQKDERFSIRSPHFFIPVDSTNNLISGKNRKNAMTFAEFKALLL